MKKLVLLLVLLLAGCARIESGRVIDKKFIPATSYVSVGYDPIAGMPVSTVEYDPDMWYITIENEIEGRVVTRNIYVKKEVFDYYNEGDWYGN